MGIVTGWAALLIVLSVFTNPIVIIIALAFALSFTLLWISHIAAFLVRGRVGVEVSSANKTRHGVWIDSPEGAFVPNPSLIGKATFKFVSKHTKNATVPTGQTQFRFNAADLDFHSDTYEWLVVAGPLAKFKGTGTINGGGNCGFMVTAIDGDVNGGRGVDKFRIKIWDKGDGDSVIYDNKLGEPEDSDAATALGSGSIAVHKK